MTAKNAAAHLKTAGDAIEQAADGLDGILKARTFLSKTELAEAEKEVARIKQQVDDVVFLIEKFRKIAVAVDPQNGHLP